MLTPKNNQSLDVDFFRATAAVYLWISFADGRATKKEIEGYVNFLLGFSVIDELAESAYLDIFLDLSDVFFKDFDKGVSIATEYIKPISKRKGFNKELIHLARKAIISDSVLNEREELVLAEVCNLLGVSEDEV